MAVNGSHFPTQDSLRTWQERYLQSVVRGLRPDAVAHKITLHLNRFITEFESIYGHDRISVWVQRDVVRWLQALQVRGLAAATINNHLASLSGFATWVHAQSPQAFAMGDPTKGVGELPLPVLEPRALTEKQIETLKNLCDRLDTFYRKKGRRWRKQLAAGERPPLRAKARPQRDRAIVLVLLSTGLRREELVELNLDQLVPADYKQLRRARRAKLERVQGKGKTERRVFLSADARRALADYLEEERVQDINPDLPPAEQPLFLSAVNVQPRKTNGRLSRRSINLILEQIGRWHDAEMRDPERHISPLRPHDLRHTFAFQLAKATGADAYELERRLGHRSQRYIQRYTNPPEQVAAEFVESF
jgi:integrase